MDPKLFNYILRYKIFSTGDEDINILKDIYTFKDEAFEWKAKSCNQYYDVDREKRR